MPCEILLCRKIFYKMEGGEGVSRSLHNSDLFFSQPVKLVDQVVQSTSFVKVGKNWLIGSEG